METAFQFAILAIDALKFHEIDKEVLLRIEVWHEHAVEQCLATIAQRQFADQLIAEVVFELLELLFVRLRNEDLHHFVQVECVHHFASARRFACQSSAAQLQGI